MSYWSEGGLLAEQQLKQFNSYVIEGDMDAAGNMIGGNGGQAQNLYWFIERKVSDIVFKSGDGPFVDIQVGDALST